MAIQVRRGNYNDFDPTRMVAGEFAVCLDNGYVYMTISPGQVVQLGTATVVQNFAELSEAWAVGTKNGTAVPSTDPQYNNNSKYYAETSEVSAEDSEAWAVGQRNGVDVSSTDPTYHNNAKYWADNMNVRFTESTDASSTRYACQILTVNEVDYTISDSVYMEQTISIPANTDTTFTFTNSIITTSSGIDVWASVYGIAPKSITTVNGQCDVVFNLKEATELTCRIYIR